MKKSEAMDLYEGLNEISPQMIEEAGNYKKTASVDIRYKKSNNVKKIIAAGLVAAAAVTAVLGVRGLKPSVTGNGNQSSNQLASEQTGFKIAHVMQPGLMTHQNVFFLMMRKMLVYQELWLEFQAGLEIHL